MFLQRLKLLSKCSNLCRIAVSKQNNLMKKSTFLSTTRNITNEPSLLNGKDPSEATAGTMAQVKQNMIKTLGIQTYYNPIVSSREHLCKFVPESQEGLPPRKMQDSFTSAIIPIGSDLALRDKYVGFLGTVRTGRLMEDMDMFAVWIVHQHLQIPDLDADIHLPYTFVTILVDKIDFTDLVPKHDADIRLSGHVSWVGKSSIETVIWVEQKQHGKWRKLTRALFLMAARDPTNTRAAPVNPLVPQNDEEKAIFEGGESRKRRRGQLHKQDLMKHLPNQYEQSLVHEMFKKTIDLSSKAFNQRILPTGCMWMEDADLSNIIFSHPEDRNAHNKVFGGFLMRHALELSWALAYNFSKHRPKLEHISDISFLQPVDVSSLINMTAHVIYTEMQYMEIVVMAEVFDPISGQRATTNSFFYTYSSPERLPQILPRTYHEALWYLDGRRKFQYAMGLDQPQK